MEMEVLALSPGQLFHRRVVEESSQFHLPPLPIVQSFRTIVLPRLPFIGRQTSPFFPVVARY